MSISTDLIIYVHLFNMVNKETNLSLRMLNYCVDLCVNIKFKAHCCDSKHGFFIVRLTFCSVA